MIEILKKRINRLEFEICRLEVAHDSGRYDGMNEVYFDMMLVLKAKLAIYREDLSRLTDN